MVTKDRIQAILPELRQLRLLGMTKYSDDMFELEFGANVVIPEDPDKPTRFTTPEEDEEVERKLNEEHQKKVDADLYGAA